MSTLASPSPTQPRPRRRKWLTSQRLTLGILSVLAFVFIAPLVWLFLTALKSPGEIAAFPIHWLPQHLDWGNFARAVTVIDFSHYLVNTVTIAVIYTTLSTLSCAFVGFGFARLRGRGKRALFLVMLSTIMLPPILTAIPTFILFANVGLVDTYWPWALWGFAAPPFITFLFRQFFSSLPMELEEAAIIDGCSYWRIFWQIFLPLSGPVLATAVILSLTSVWGDWFTPSLFLSDQNTTLGVAIRTGYTDSFGNVPVNLLSAGAFLYAAPVMLVFIIAQRYFVRGIATSGLKG